MRFVRGLLLQTGKSRPTVSRHHPAEVAAQLGRAFLDAAVGLVGFLEGLHLGTRTVVDTAFSAGCSLGKRLEDVLVQCRLILLHREQVVSLSLDDSPGDRSLASHRVDGDRCAT